MTEILHKSDIPFVLDKLLENSDSEGRHDDSDMNPHYIPSDNEGEN